ncbi:MAG: polysaccharide biosynthesis protein [Clostridiales bacterium]|jgi:hypothetical protein|nr:polysaccharide biosynthesis protein [Clostridiales bacterium]
MKKKVLFISSTGGHLNELLQLKSLFSNYDYLLVTEKDKSTISLKDKYNVKYLVYGTRKNLFSYFFKFIFNFIKSFIIFIKFKPDVIITTGAHTCVAMIFIAKLFKKKSIYIETMANRKTKTMTGKIVEKWVTYFVVQWEDMKNLYEDSVYGGLIY